MNFESNRKEEKMKNSVLLTLTVLTLLGCSRSDSIPEPRWKSIDTPTTNTLEDIHFSSSNFGVACGGFGTLLKTEDAGASWQNLDVGVGYSFLSAFALNESEIFTSRIGLYKSIDAGDSFDEMGDLASFGATIFDIHFFDSQNGIIDKGTSVYRTSDGGQNWTQAYAYESYADMLEVTDNSTVYLAGGITYDTIGAGEMHKSTDNGLTWEQMLLPEEIASAQITAIDFLDHQTGYISTFENKVFKTSDGGNNWSLKAELGFGPVTDLVFKNESIGYLIRGNKIYATTNGGAKWSTEYQAAAGIVLTSITAAPNGAVYITGKEGKLFKRD